jgi:hypothetical protein
MKILKRKRQNRGGSSNNDNSKTEMKTTLNDE